jgi:hypothetical protein
MVQIWKIRFPEEYLLALCYIYQDKFFAFSQPSPLAFFLYQSHPTGIYEELVMPVHYQSFHGHE